MNLDSTLFPTEFIHTCPPLDEVGVDEYYNEVVLDKNHLSHIVDTLTETKRRFIAKAIIKANGLVKHQFQHYEKFMDVYLPNIIHENSTIVVDSDVSKKRHVIEFGNVTVTRPSFTESNGTSKAIFPYECRARGLTYSCSILCDVLYNIYDTTQFTKEELLEKGKQCDGLSICSSQIVRETLLCQIPCMIRSKFCWLNDMYEFCNENPDDPGAIFIINGNEKCLITQEKLRTNYPCIFVDKNSSKYTYTCEIRCCHESKIRSTSTLFIHMLSSKTNNMCTNNDVVVNIPFIQKVTKKFLDIPLLSVYRLFGVDTIEEAKSMIQEHNTLENDEDMDKLIVSVLKNDLNELPYKDLCEWIGKEGTTEITKEKRIKYVEHILANELLPHIGLDRSEETKKKKAIFLSYCVFNMFCVFLKRRKPDDRDHNMLKRMETSGFLFAHLIRPLIKTMQKNAENHIKRHIDDGKMISVPDIINHKKTTSSIKYAMATGNWGPQKGASTTTGVAQVHKRMTVTAGYSNLRKVSTPINKEGKMTKPRQLHHSHWGILCPVETPEGHTCGTIRNLALGCHIRAGYDTRSIVEQLHTFEGFVTIEACTAFERKNGVIVFSNGTIAGYTMNPDSFVIQCKRSRTKQCIPFDTSIVYKPGTKTIHITVESGCCVRPLFNISRVHRLTKDTLTNGTWKELLNKLLVEGIVEYVGKEEEGTYRVAVYPKDLLKEDNSIDEPYTHIEIHPMLNLGVCASLIPFMNRNQSPRNTYECAMQKQSQSCAPLNNEYKMDAQSMGLCNPEVPLIQTMMDDCLGINKSPMGQNAMWCIAIFMGYTQEDATVINASSIQRGFLRSWIRKTYRDQEKTKSTDSTKFGKPPTKNCHGLRNANYSKIENDGLPLPGSTMKYGDVIIAKTMVTEEIVDPETPKSTDPTHRNKSITRDNSCLFMSNESAIVEKIVKTKNREGANAVKVLTTSFRSPEEGDKLSSRHGQKGTIGKIYRQEDMPFNAKGETPDIMMNAHAMPSRMTFGMMLEGLTGKVCCSKGTIGDGTPFVDNELTVEEVAAQLQSYGYQRYGKEQFMHPWTGEPIEALLFYAPMNYQRLYHMAIDKIHARSTGPVQLLTQQPVEGRARQGGFRFGEMERDVTVSAGSAFFLKDRLFEQSDAYETVVCEQCGLLAEPSRPDSYKIRGTYVRAEKPYCRNCDRTDTVRSIKMPYCNKLLIQELASCNLYVRLRFEGKLPQKIQKNIHTNLKKRILDLPKESKPVKKQKKTTFNVKCVIDDNEISTLE